MVNYAVLVSAVLWLISALVQDHPRYYAGAACCFILGAFSFSFAVIIELVRFWGG